MTISANYPTPIIVNGFSCRNCSDVARAEKNIDPSDPMGGPFGINSVKGSAAARDRRFDAHAVDSGVLAAAHVRAADRPDSPVAQAYASAPIADPFVWISV